MASETRVTGCVSGDDSTTFSPIAKPTPTSPRQISIGDCSASGTPRHEKIAGRPAGERHRQPDDDDPEQVELLADRLRRPDERERDQPDRVHHGEWVAEQHRDETSTHCLPLRARVC